ncbi:hypothetical protein BD410DRAFT_784827 [Rickenella mellea]|uniref:Aminoglycoside phosphotransferase domain-containing protein n=1 Tax=Rickenella mellea TaxID=50990 RepID=A0A4Y7QDN6_9AGAM|nr:hypothetical protein BD410DRAFT_784827 [Rickenella mellea]
MPTPIEELSQEQALAEAQCVAAGFCEADPISAQMCDVQGMFSLSIIVTLSDDTKFVVQLRDNDVDTTMVTLAYSLLGEVVPPLHAARTSVVRAAYVAPFVPGTVWDELNCSLDDDVKIASQIGELLGRCFLNVDSSGMVDRFIIPRLRKILAKERIPTKELRERIEGMILSAENLKALPLGICHIDVNASNIIIDNESNIAGLIDWEMAAFLPIGMGAWGIRNLATVNRNRTIYLLDKTQPMSEAFWKGFIKNLTPSAKSNLHAIIDGMEIGLLFFNGYCEGCETNEKVLAGLLESLDWIRSTFEPLCRNMNHS